MFVIQNIRQPEQFYYADCLSNAKRYKTKLGAERAIAKYQPGHYIIIDESLIATPEHQELFIKTRILHEKNANDTYREHYQQFMPSLPEVSDERFEKLAQDAWNIYIAKHANKV